ncbi:MAG: hypothetical protein ACJ740_02370 [Gaiellales bacterium]|jgi:hypothetical protein|nr:hypothetical protein [Gaiellales bacterium]
MGWNVSSDRMTIEPPQRRSPARWIRENSLRIAVVVGLTEAAVAYFSGVRYLWAAGLLAVFAYWYVRKRVPQWLRRPLWIVAMSQAIAGLAVPALFGALFITFVIGAVLLLMMVLVMLGDLRRT